MLKLLIIERNDNMKSVNVLAFDFGASSGRAILGAFDGEKITLTETHRFSNDPVSVNSHLHWDVLRLFHEIKEGILKTVNKGLGDISSLGIDTWGVDFGLIGKNGEMLSNPYHYRDTRTAGMIEKANDIAGGDFIYNQTGIQTIWFNTLYQLLSMKESRSMLLEMADKLLFMPDLFNYFLTGVKLTEYSIASTSQLLDARNKNWSDEIINKFGFNRSLFTDIISSGTIIGNITEDISSELRLPKIPVVAVAGHDTGSAVASVPFEDTQSSVFISSGTWSLMGAELSEPCISKKSMDYNFTNEGGVFGTIRFLKNIMGLWIIQECRRQWQREGEDVSFAELENTAWQSEGLVSFIDPDDDSFATPGNMPERIKNYCAETNQPIPETKGDIIRCVAQSLALKYRSTLESIEDVLGRPIKIINMVGGGIKDKMVCSFTANATGRTVKAGPVEATAAGNIIMQLFALGEINSLAQGREIVKRSFDFHEYTPQEGGKWDEAYQKYLKIIK
jgi:rhamnulokinase